MTPAGFLAMLDAATPAERIAIAAKIDGLLASMPARIPASKVEIDRSSWGPSPPAKAPAYTRGETEGAITRPRT